MSKHEDKIKTGAQPYLQDGEQVLAAFIARPRGWTQSMAGARGLGRSQVNANTGGAESAGFSLASPMALAITQRRLLSLELGTAVGMGVGGDVKDLAGEAPLSDVDEIKIKRLLVGKVVSLSVRGQEFKLEVNGAANASGVVDEWKAATGR
jgi:hypothetical protein